MEAEALKTMGQVAGIGGLALGIFLFLTRDLIKQVVIPRLTRKDFRLVLLAVWSIVVLGLGAWVYLEQAGTVAANGGVAAGRDLEARDIRVHGEGDQAESGGVNAGRDLKARDITVGDEPRRD
jgi:hypothetical protein